MPQKESTNIITFSSFVVAKKILVIIIVYHIGFNKSKKCQDYKALRCKRKDVQTQKT